MALLFRPFRDSIDVGRQNPVLKRWAIVDAWLALAASGLTGWFSLPWRLRLRGCGSIAVEQDAVRAQISDQRVQIVR